jgi:hypothetical protein
MLSRVDQRIAGDRGVPQNAYSTATSVSGGASTIRFALLASISSNVMSTWRRAHDAVGEIG